MKYKWLLFDADGTLFDYEKAEKVALKKTFESFDIKFEPEYLLTYQRINEQIWKAFEKGEITQKEIKTERFQLLGNALDMDFAATEFGRHYLINLGNGSYLLNGAQKLIESLYGHVGLVIITNGLKSVQRSRMALSTIKNYFSDIIISEEVGYAKPDNHIFDVAFEKMGNPKKNDVLIIGDSLTSDMMGGYKYGINTCWYNPSGKTCDQDLTINYEIRNLSEIKNIVE